MKLRYHPNARTELRAALRIGEEERAGRGIALQELVRAVERRICKVPRSAPRWPRLRTPLRDQEGGRTQDAASGRLRDSADPDRRRGDRAYTQGPGLLARPTLRPGLSHCSAWLNGERPLQARSRAARSGCGRASGRATPRESRRRPHRRSGRRSTQSCRCRRRTERPR